MSGELISPLSGTELEQGMDETTKLEQLRFLSKTHRMLHEQRRRIEQRVLLTTLSLYVLSAFAVLKGDIDEIKTALKLGLWAAFLILALIAAAYLRSIHRANRINLSIAEAAEGDIATMVDSEAVNQVVEDSSKARVHPFWSWWWQATTIFVVALASALIITLTQ